MSELHGGVADCPYVLKQRKRERTRMVDSEEEEIQMSTQDEVEDCDMGSSSANATSGNFAGLTVAISKKKPDNKRSYDKLLPCCICGKLLKCKIKRHLETVHVNDPEVAKVMALPSKNERKTGFDALAARGMFQHNSSVLSAKNGILIPCRRSSKHDRNPADYLPCQHCVRFFLKAELWRHEKRCPKKPSETDSSTEDKKRGRSVTAASRMLLEGSLRSDQPLVSPEFNEQVLAKMHHDTFYSRLRYDPLILKLGSTQHHKHGERRKNVTSQEMRQLSRLLKEVSEDNAGDEPTTLASLLTGSNFDRVVAAAERLSCRYQDSDTGRPMCRKPSVGLKLGHLLRKCAQLKKGDAIRTGDKVMGKEADAFMSLHDGEWTSKIASASSTSLKHRQYNNPDVLPLTKDLVKLREYQEKALGAYTEALRKKQTYTNWRLLSDIVYTRVVIFNKRRGGETAKLALNAFLKRPKWHEVANDVLLQTLNPLEASRREAHETVFIHSFIHSFRPFL